MSRHGDSPSPCFALPSASVRCADESLTRLARHARAGDPDAWRELISSCQPRLRSIVASYRLQPADVEDVLQNVWIRCFEHLDTIREPAALRGWLATTARREALHVLRRQGRTELRPALADAELGHGTGSDEEVLAGELSRGLRAAVTQLPHRHQRLIVMTLLDPHATQRELARRLAMPVGSVGPTRVRGLGRLRSDSSLAGLVMAA